MTLRPLFAAPLLLLAGCVGNLDIWGVNFPIPGPGDDDDSVPDIDFSAYSGFEFINIDWDQQQRPGGVQDCIGQDGWEVNGAETTADDQGRCPDCDHIWTLTYIASVGLGACLESTGLPADTGFQRKVGFQFLDAQGFTVWRNVDDPDRPLDPVGQGALREDATFTWGGGADHRFGSDPAFNYYFSGEGAF